MPCELVQHFDPGVPLLVGGVLPAEEGTAHLQLRLKRHRWFPKTLKTRDPLVFSIGACFAEIRLHTQILGAWADDPSLRDQRLWPAPLSPAVTSRASTAGSFQAGCSCERMSPTLSTG